MTSNSIVDALKAVEDDAKAAHREQLAHVRQMGDTIGRGDDDVVQEFEEAIAQYQEGRKRLADAIARAAARIGNRKSGFVNVESSEIDTDSETKMNHRPLPHETNESLKLY
ncbi:MAG: hypothetical protein ACR2PA_06390 [Hyphomicrobiaceae bacterium]